VADGEDVYLLKESGSIDRIWQGVRHVSQSVDPATGTRQIAPAGGVLYVLKENGNIWALQSISAGEKPDAFQLKDSGTGTRAVLAAGETLYVLKENVNGDADGPRSIGRNSLKKVQLVAFNSEDGDIVAPRVYSQQQSVVRG
jgi:hypothetical protein